MACFAPTASANWRSNSFVFGPVVTQPERSASVTSRTSSSSMSGRANGRNDSRMDGAGGALIIRFLNVQDVFVHGTPLGRYIVGDDRESLRAVKRIDGVVADFIRSQHDRARAAPAYSVDERLNQHLSRAAALHAGIDSKRHQQRP